MTVVNTEQYEHWNREAEGWIANHHRIDSMLGVFDAPLLEAAAISPGKHVLDVGCGTGATTVAAARAATPGGGALGVDLSASMVEEGRRRAAEEGVEAVFEQADAEVHPFQEGRYDAVISRFGLMFFGNPTAAFANLRRATREGGRVAFVSWQPLMSQQWMLVMGAALMQHVSMPASMPADGPGMFGLADPHRIRSILNQAGWVNIEIVDHRVPLLLGGGGSVEDMLGFFGNGMLKMVLGDADEAVRSRALESLRSALAPHETGEGVLLEGAVWLVTADAAVGTGRRNSVT